MFRMKHIAILVLLLLIHSSPAMAENSKPVVTDFESFFDKSFSIEIKTPSATAKSKFSDLEFSESRETTFTKAQNIIKEYLNDKTMCPNGFTLNKVTNRRQYLRNKLLQKMHGSRYWVWLIYNGECL